MCVYVCELFTYLLRHMCMHMWYVWCMCVMYFCGAYVYVHVWCTCVSLCVCGMCEYVCGMYMLHVHVCVWYMCTYLCSIPTHECAGGQKKMSGVLSVTRHVVLRQGLLLNLSWPANPSCPPVSGPTAPGFWSHASPHKPLRGL